MPRIDSYDPIESIADDDLLLISDTSANNTTNSVEVSSLASHINIGKQNQLTLTTTGTSGAATLTGATLNIPQYSNSTTFSITDGSTTGQMSNGGTLRFTSGTGISAVLSGSGSSSILTITNSAPDQTVSLTPGTGVSISGAYPNFTITNSSPDTGLPAILNAPQGTPSLSTGVTAAEVRTLISAALDSDVTTNTGNISTNTSNISTNTTAIGLKVNKAGDTMTGALILSGAPTANLEAATKAYVDTQVATKVDGTGTTHTLPVWTDGAAGVLGDSMLSQNAGATEAFVNGKLVGTGGDFYIESQTDGIIIRTTADNEDVFIQSDNGSGQIASYFQADGSTGAVRLFHYGVNKLETTSNGVEINGNLGIGVNVPYSELHVRSDGNPVATIESYQSTGGNFQAAIVSLRAEETSTSTLSRGSLTIHGPNSLNAAGANNFVVNNFTNGGQVVIATQNSSGAGKYPARFKADGDIQLEEYGSGTFTGTAAYSVSVDTNGNLIETPNVITQTYGTYTPQLVCSNSDLTVNSYSAQTGRWIRVGNMVTCDFIINVSNITISNTTSNATIAIQGTPYNPLSTFSPVTGYISFSSGFASPLNDVIVLTGSSSYIGNLNFQPGIKSTTITNYYFPDDLRVKHFVNVGSTFKIMGSYTYVTNTSTLNSGAAVT